MKKRIKLCGRSSASYQRLFLQEDYLLFIDGSFSEEYTKIPLREVAALVWVETQTWMLLNVILGGLTLILGLTFMSSFYGDVPMGEGGVFSLFVGVPVAILFFSNLLMGPTGRMDVRTRVQQKTIAGVNRLRKVRKIISILQPRIEAVQGGPALSYTALREFQTRKEEAERAARQAVAQRQVASGAYNPFAPEAQQGSRATPPPLPPKLPAPPPPVE